MRESTERCAICERAPGTHAGLWDHEPVKVCPECLEQETALPRACCEVFRVALEPELVGVGAEDVDRGE